MCLCFFCLFVFCLPCGSKHSTTERVAILGHREYLHQIDSPMRFRREWCWCSRWWWWRPCLPRPMSSVWSNPLGWTGVKGYLSFQHNLILPLTYFKILVQRFTDGCFLAKMHHFTNNTKHYKQILSPSTSFCAYLSITFYFLVFQYNKTMKVWPYELV